MRWLALIWAIAQVCFLWARGIHEDGEAQTYIALANKVLAAKSLSALPLNYFLYLGHISILLGLKNLGLSYTALYGINLLSGGLGFICFVKLLRLYQLAPAAIFVSAILFCICPVFHEWSCFLYTDYIFANLLLIAVYLLVSTGQRPYRRWAFFMLTFALCFYRPLGVLLFPVAIAFWITQGWKQRLFSIFLSLVSFVSVLLFIYYILNHSTDYFYPRHNTEANIICGYPSTLTRFIRHPYDPQKSIVVFFMENPALTWRLFLHRLYKAFWMTRPYFSPGHNLLLSVVLVFYYCLFALGVVALVQQKRFARSMYIFLGLAIFTTPIVVFCADWGNRFILPTLVFLFIVVAFGINHLLLLYRKWSNRARP